MIFALLGLAPAHAVTPVEQVEPYAISGQSGAELYASIGARGPKLSDGRRTIAHTTFKLTWRRDYRPQADGACVLATAIPKLIITYTLPKPRGAMPAPVAQRWKRFYDGVAAHERVHGRYIVEMVEKIEAVSTGMRAEDDPGCQKVRAFLQRNLKVLSDEQRARGRAFDRDEMSAGGNVQGLIFDLIK
ncbi:DUF922 domain-containing Zn-dependent protease [Pseudohoeflea coraliihabitans]|uniref:DUF922 domain-containing protein n=1 Tax=Pseudohoeflea coraliihabitans TaxID=2860393 RepID=A0ABS6WIY4_9HYPH|nr:DUF922 domain-containing protein [Pseudohoeflea sp. DP4N28-3]MBW3095896.1 DUF922 domain-containing protein [Pseudohoeflea sp. DP4N28-3]